MFWDILMTVFLIHLLLFLVTQSIILSNSQHILSLLKSNLKQYGNSIMINNNNSNNKKKALHLLSVNP